nr:MAG TPA: hypothetical protein [Caudoviricetes sp.]
MHDLLSPIAPCKGLTREKCNRLAASKNRWFPVALRIFRSGILNYRSRVVFTRCHEDDNIEISQRFTVRQGTLKAIFN